MNELKSGYTLQQGKFRIIKKLGQGGFGITYQAENQMLKKKVCIKEFFVRNYCDRDEATCRVTLGTRSNEEMIKKYREKFLSEARRTSQFEHPNIIKVIDVFEENGTAYYVMEYIDGINLNDMVKSHGTLKESLALKYIGEVADGLAYVHSQNINHLDIKPSNILVKKNNDIAILIDFGSSKQYDENGEQTSRTPVGISAGYAPIELGIAGGIQNFSPQTDIYELGATLYTLLTGKVPPTANEIAEEGLPELPMTISQATRDAIEMSMQVKRIDRPSTVEDFIEMLTGTTIIDNENDDIDTILTGDTEIVPSKGKEKKQDEKGPMALRLISFSCSIIKMMQTLSKIEGIDEDLAFLILNDLPCIILEGATSKHAMKVGLMLEEVGAKVEIFDKAKQDLEEKLAKEEKERKEREERLKREREEKERKEKEAKRKREQEEIERKERVEKLKREREERERQEKEAKRKREQEEREKKEREEKERLAKISYSKEYVDLGLSVLWAKCNLGATKMEESGEFYSFGETEPKDSYTLENYKFYKGKDAKNNIIVTKYNCKKAYGNVDYKEVLEPEDDAAHIHLGGSWRIPTSDEMNELKENCNWSWTRYNGVYGYILTSQIPGYSDKWIFLPALYSTKGGSKFDDPKGFYRTSEISPYYCDENDALVIDKDDYDIYESGRNTAYSIRPVLVKDFSSEINKRDRGVDYSNKFVDLGLSVKWGKCNLGAKRPEEYGDYYAWGEVEPKQSYRLANYKFTDLNIYDKVSFTKYSRNSLTTLEKQDDAAYNKLGSNWRMPTPDEFEELLNTDNCEWTWMVLNRHKGFKVRSKKRGFTDNWIFLPFTGYMENAATHEKENRGKYWSNTLDRGVCKVEEDAYSKELYIWQGYTCDVSEFYRYRGCAIRPVYDDSIKTDNHDTPYETDTVMEDLIKECYKEQEEADNIEFVDMGLNVLWAKCNLGADKPEHYGDYFAWGETKPKGKFTQENYKYIKPNGKPSKYTSGLMGLLGGDRKVLLEPCDDAAKCILGDDWHIPTIEDFDKLMRNCDATLETKVNGKKMIRFTSKINSNWIEFPLAGSPRSINIENTEVFGNYLSSSLSNLSDSNCQIFHLSLARYRLDAMSRWFGYSIRPVKKKKSKF